MALIGATKTTLTRSIPIWQSVRVFETAQGGFTLVLPTVPYENNIIPAGTAVHINEATRMATVGADSDTAVANPSGLLYEDVIATEGATVSVVVKGTVYARRIPIADAGLIAALPNILFSQSF